MGNKDRRSKQDRNLEAGADAEAMEGYCLLAFSACFLTETRATSPGMVSPTMGWALLYQSLIKNMPYRLAYSPILWGHCRNKAPSSLMTG